MTNSEENWRPVSGYEGVYSVSDHGRMRSDSRVATYFLARGEVTRHYAEKLLVIRLGTDGYPIVTLRKSGANRTLRVHRLVLESFVGPRPVGMCARHLDDNRDNNNLSNLAWGTPLENSLDARSNGRLNQNSNKTHCPQGHAYSADNTVLWKSNRRGCRTCQRVSHQKSREKKRTKYTEGKTHE